MRHLSAGKRDTNISLKPFQEIIGRLETIQQTEAAITIELSSGTLQFPATSMEADICEQELKGREGARVSILRIPSQGNPLLIRISTDDERL